MKAREKKMTSEAQKPGLLRAMTRRRTWKWAATALVVVAASFGLGFIVVGHAGRAARESLPPTPTISTPRTSTPAKSTTAAQGTALSGLFDYRLAIQPEANKVRRRLGRRFQTTGLETTVSDALLTVGSQHQPVRIIRLRGDDGGEQVALALGGGPASLSWNAREGAKSAGKAPNSDDRRLIERIVLDSPDQFILAQTRGASYYTVAELVRPEDVADPESYSGPLWDLVRIIEPKTETTINPESEWRIYYLNASTGLIDKVLHKEQGETITAELSDWRSWGGEISPALIQWKRGGQVIMQVSFNSVTHGPK